MKRKKNDLIKFADKILDIKLSIGQRLMIDNDITIESFVTRQQRKRVLRFYKNLKKIKTNRGSKCICYNNG